jgi:N-acetylglucosamine-6-phosphate deacetylase
MDLPPDLSVDGDMNCSRVRARHYADRHVLDIAIANGTIQSVTKSHCEGDACWVAPALFDLQINGCRGKSFNSPSLTREDIHRVVATCRSHGIASFCPTVITNSPDAMLRCLDTLRATCEADRDLAAAMPAIHIEGPYLSPEDGPRGAHPLRYIREPDWDEFSRLQEAAGKRIRLVTLAPERKGAIQFIERLTKQGVVAAIGHTAANECHIRDAIAAGAKLSTHLGNGAHAMLPRHPNYIWDQLAADDLWASVISDGRHLPPSVVRTILKVKTPARTILTCDAGSLAGLPPGRYREWDQDLEVLTDGSIVLPGTQYLAGSGVFTDTCVRNVITHAGVSVRDAIDMASAGPRQLLGLEPRLLAADGPADLILFDSDEEQRFVLLGTVVRGIFYPPPEDKSTSRYRTG